MSIIYLTTHINAGIKTVFDLSRSIDLHLISTQHTNERVIAGKSSGLCTKGDIITWEAKHLGVYQRLTVEIVQCNFPNFFEDRMVKGGFKSFTHRHYFESDQDKTIMRDVFEFESPFGIIGKVVNRIFLARYMTNLLFTRNLIIKAYAESSDGERLPGTL